MTCDQSTACCRNETTRTTRGSVGHKQTDRLPAFCPSLGTTQSAVPIPFSCHVHCSPPSCHSFEISAPRRRCTGLQVCNRCGGAARLLFCSTLLQASHCSLLTVHFLPLTAHCSPLTGAASLQMSLLLLEGSLFDQSYS